MSLTLGPFVVSPDGLLQPARPDASPALRFAWRGRRCEAALHPDGLKLASVAARVPSTAETGGDRDRTFAELAALPRTLPDGWRVKLLPDHRIRVDADTPMDSPPTATRLITAMVRFALELDPYLDRLESAGAGVPPAAPSGTANT